MRDEPAGQFAVEDGHQWIERIAVDAAGCSTKPGDITAGFTTAGNHTFRFSFRNQFGTNAGDSNVYLQVDSNPNDESGVPEPATWLAGLAAIALVWARRRALL